jgi:hypothetical protein
MRHAGHAAHILHAADAARALKERRSARRQTATLGSERFRRRFGAEEANASFSEVGWYSGR